MLFVVFKSQTLNFVAQVFAINSNAVLGVLVKCLAVQQFVLCCAQAKTSVVVPDFECLVLVQNGVDIAVHPLLHFRVLHLAAGNVGLEFGDFVVGFSDLVLQILALLLEVSNVCISVVLHSLLAVFQGLEVVKNLFIVFVGLSLESVVLVQFADQIFVFSFCFVQSEFVFRNLALECKLLVLVAAFVRLFLSADVFEVILHPSVFGLRVADGHVQLLQVQFGVVSCLGEFFTLDFDGGLQPFCFIVEHTGALGQFLVFAVESFVLLLQSEDQAFVLIADFRKIL